LNYITIEQSVRKPSCRFQLYIQVMSNARLVLHEQTLTTPANWWLAYSWLALNYCSTKKCEMSSIGLLALKYTQAWILHWQLLHHIYWA